MRALMLMKTVLIVLAAGCAQLPDAGLHMGARDAPQVEIESARGPLSTQRVAAILSKLSRNAGELDILQQHVAVEQAIVGSPLTAGDGRRRAGARVQPGEPAVGPEGVARQ